MPQSEEKESRFSGEYEIVGKSAISEDERKEHERRQALARKLLPETDEEEE
ncbi:MAG: hypothetical protein M0Q91_07625 [Methanoregula sp.]|nr:hypothetical protein [Methanoregula sp.]